MRSSINDHKVCGVKGVGVQKSNGASIEVFGQFSIRKFSPILYYRLVLPTAGQGGLEMGTGCHAVSDYIFLSGYEHVRDESALQKIFN